MPTPKRYRVLFRRPAGRAYADQPQVVRLVLADLSAALADAHLVPVSRPRIRYATERFRMEGDPPVYAVVADVEVAHADA